MSALAIALPAACIPTYLFMAAIDPYGRSILAGAAERIHNLALRIRELVWNVREWVRRSKDRLD